MITIRKVFFVWQSIREKEWLESMAINGYILEKVGLFKYVFRKDMKQDLVYEFDFQILNKKTEPEYLELFQDWKLVSKFGSWYYFSKERENNNRDVIYNDHKSKADMFKRIIIFLLIVGFPLYYQTIIFFPNMDDSNFEFPNFYFFFRIIVLIFTGLHIFALLNVYLIYRTQYKHFSE